MQIPDRKETRHKKRIRNNPITSINCETSLNHLINATSVSFVRIVKKE